jgi:hypothetical protein
MALIGNRSVLLKSPGRFLSGTVASIERNNFSTAGQLASRFQAMSPIFGGIPSGHLAPSSWSLPRTAGGGSGLAQSVSDAIGALAGGINIEGLAVSTSDAFGAGQTVASIEGAAASTSTATGTASASLLASGTAASTSTASGAVTALGWAVGEAGSSASASLVSYATGAIAGTTLDNSTLTAAGVASAVWQTVAAEQNAAGTMGSKLNTASSGGVDLNALAAAVWGHTVRTLTAASLPTPQQAQLQDVWQRLGLDPANPQTTTATTISAGGVQQSISESAGVVTVTRAP